MFDLTSKYTLFVNHRSKDKKEDDGKKKNLIKREDEEHAWEMERRNEFLWWIEEEEMSGEVISSCIAISLCLFYISSAAERKWKIVSDPACPSKPERPIPHSARSCAVPVCEARFFLGLLYADPNPPRNNPLQVKPVVQVQHCRLYLGLIT